MATRSVDVKVTFDDEEYRQAISRIKGETAVLKSQLDATKASFKGNEDSIQAMSARIKDLEPLIDAANSKINLENREIEKQKNNIATCAAQIQEWNGILSDSKKALDVLSSAQIHNYADVARLSAEYEQSKARYDEAKKSLDELNEKYTGSTRNFPWFKQKLSEAVDEVERAKRAHEQAGNNLESAKKEIKHTGEAITAYKHDVVEAGNEVKAWTKKEADAEGYLRRHTTELNKAQKELNQHSAALKEDQKNIKDCKDANVDSLKALEELNKEREREQKLIEAAAYETVKKFFEDYKKEIRECVEEYEKLQTAMIGVAKTNDMTTEQLHDLQENFKALSVMIPVSATELAKIAELGGQLGISVEGLEKFATTIANISVSTNLNIEEASTAMAQFANIVGLTEDQYERLGSAIVGLGNNFATDEKTIMLMSQRFASAGVSANMSAKDIVALATAAGSLGFQADAGASGITKLIEKVKEAVDTGENLDKFAELAGMTGKEFARAFGEDAVGATAKFLKGLGETGTELDSYASRLGFSEIRAKRLVTSLAAAEASNGLLTRSIEEANTAWAENIALQQEADKYNASLENKIKELKNAVDNLEASVGEQLAPAAEAGVSIAKTGVVVINDLVTAFPELVKIVSIASAVFAAFALKSLPQTFTNLAVLQGKLVQLATGAWAEFTSAVNGAQAAVAAASAGTLVLAGASTVAFAATIAMMKEEAKVAKENKENDLTAYEEEFKYINHITDAKKRYLEIEQARDDLIDSIVKKGRQATITEQAQIDTYNEALEKLNKRMGNIHERAVENAKKRRETIHLETADYDALAASIYDTAKAEDYYTDKKTTDYDLTYTKVQENLESQKKWAEDYLKNFDNLINRNIDGIEEWVLSWADGTQEAAEKQAVFAQLSDKEIEDLMASADKVDGLFAQVGEAPAKLQEKIDAQDVFASMVDDARLAVDEIHRLLASINGVEVKGHFSMMGQYLTEHAQGLNYVPYDEYPALLHEGEMVLNRAEARMYRAMEKHGDAMRNTNNNIVFNVYGAKGQSAEEIANVVMNKIQQATDRRVAVWA